VSIRAVTLHIFIISESTNHCRKTLLIKHRRGYNIEQKRKIMTPNHDIFNNPDLLVRIWENERKTRDFAVKLMWENMKYFSILIGSLLTAYTALLGYISTKTIFFAIYQITIIFNFMILFPIPAVIIVLALYAQNDLIERRRRFLLIVTHLLKLEELLGLHKKIDDKLQYFKQDEFLFVEYQKNLSQVKSETFIDTQMREKTSAFTSMQNVYIVLMGIAGLSILFGIIVLSNPSAIRI
jgi:hypothetical protein